MRRIGLFLVAFCFAALPGTPAWALKRVPYPEVPVIALPVFAGDPALTEMRRRFAEAVAGKKLDAIVALVAPDFQWTASGATVDEFDAKRGGEHNFKVVFGFRGLGRDADGPTELGPQWELLAYFAADPVLTQEKGSPLVCTSASAKVGDLGALDTAFNLIDEENELSEWVFTLDDLELTAAPGGGATVSRFKNIALPIVGVHPAPKADEKEPPALTHFELLLPSGRSGWAPIGKLKPLFVDRLCFAGSGRDWKIAAFEQAE